MTFFIKKFYSDHIHLDLVVYCDVYVGVYVGIYARVYVGVYVGVYSVLTVQCVMCCLI